MGLCGVACSRSLCSLLHYTTQSLTLYCLQYCAACCAVLCALHRDVVLPPLVLLVSHVVVSTRSRILRFCTFQYLDISDSGILHFRYLHSGDLQLRCCDAVASYFILRAYSYITMLRPLHCTALQYMLMPLLRVGSNPWVTACAGAHARLCLACCCCAVPLLHPYSMPFGPSAVCSATHYMISTSQLLHPILRSCVSG